MADLLKISEINQLRLKAALLDESRNYGLRGRQ